MNKLYSDKRSGRIAVVAHCTLNQNSRVLGLAERPSMVTEIVELFTTYNIGVIQMPCPELKYAGILRRSQTRDQYDTAMFRSFCHEIAEEIVDQIQEYSKCGIKTEIIVGVDGSPSCGVNETSAGKRCQKKSGDKKIEGSGILIQELRWALKKRETSIPFHGIQYERLAEDAAKIEKLIKD